MCWSDARAFVTGIQLDVSILSSSSDALGTREPPALKIPRAIDGRMVLWRTGNGRARVFVLGFFTRASDYLGCNFRDSSSRQPKKMSLHRLETSCCLETRIVATEHCLFFRRGQSARR